MGLQPVFPNLQSYPFKVIPLVQTKVVRAAPSPLRFKDGERLLKRGANKAAVMDIGSHNNSPKGSTVSVHMQMDFAAVAASICGICSQTFTSIFFF